jgi:hypothetical protein
VFINFNFCLYYASVVLLDTTKEATLEWTRYPYGPQAQTPGVSSNFTDSALSQCDREMSIEFDICLKRKSELKRIFFIHLMMTIVEISGDCRNRIQHVIIITEKSLWIHHVCRLFFTSLSSSLAFPLAFHPTWKNICSFERITLHHIIPA